MTHSEQDVRLEISALSRLVCELLRRAGADDASAVAVTRSVIEASSRGVDTHGVILVPHYLKVLLSGRINGSPRLRFTQRATAVGYLDADNGFGHLAGYEAITHAVRLARRCGVAAVSVGNSSHFGAAASYTLAAAREGLIALAVSHSDAVVIPHDGVRPFHGTNPLAFAAPMRNREPLSVDLATSAIAWNRLLLLKQTSRPIPAGVIADADGMDTTELGNAAALLPLGGRGQGHKGAALASMVEILSSALTGMMHGYRLIGMEGLDMSTPRRGASMRACSRSALPAGWPPTSGSSFSPRTPSGRWSNTTSWPRSPILRPGKPCPPKNKRACLGERSCALIMTPPRARSH